MKLKLFFLPEMGEPKRKGRIGAFGVHEFGGQHPCTMS